MHHLFIILLALGFLGCNKSTETEYVDRWRTQYDTIREVDTLEIVRADTLTKIYRDTIRDTIRVVANASDPASLFGVWEGKDGIKSISLAFTKPSASTFNKADFTASIGTGSASGYISSLENGTATIIYGGFHNVTWLIAIDGGILTLQEIGDKLFSSGAIVLRKRMP